MYRAWDSMALWQHWWDYPDPAWYSSKFGGKVTKNTTLCLFSGWLCLLLMFFWQITDLGSYTNHFGCVSQLGKCAYSPLKTCNVISYISRATIPKLRPFTLTWVIWFSFHLWAFTMHILTIMMLLLQPMSVLRDISHSKSLLTWVVLPYTTMFIFTWHNVCIVSTQGSITSGSNTIVPSPNPCRVHQSICSTYQ